jgi:uncharacterized membrane protein YqhA
MKKLDRLLKAIILALSIILLFRFFGEEKFTRLDYVWLIILAVASLTTIIKEAKRKTKEN